MRSIRIVSLLAARDFRILLRSPAILAVIFLPGIVLYAIFTAIFAGPAGRPFRVAVIDDDRSPASQRLIESLAEQNVRVITTENEEPGGTPLTAESAQELIRRRGKFRVALHIPKGYGEVPDVLSGPAHHGVRMYCDALEPTEADIVVGMLQMAAGRQFFNRTFGALAGKGAAASQPDDPHLIKVERHAVAGQRMKIASKHTFLAGIVPMFLLFSCVNAARSILEALANGQMRRLLAAPISPAHVLFGEMTASLTLAFVQCVVMYLFAWSVFGVAIWSIAGGLFLLTLATCLATTGFGVFVGSFCRTTEQIDSIGTTVVLAMSAVGGSMVPRWIMPEWMQTLGLFTINGWAYDGFMALIQGGGVPGIVNVCAVLVAVAVGFSIAGSVVLTRRLRTGPGA